MPTETQYPRTVHFEDKKLAEMITEKGLLVDEGRQLSEQIEIKDAEMNSVDLKIQELEAKVDISDLKKQAEEATELFNKAVAAMNEVKQMIYDRMSPAVPKELRDAYDSAKKEKEDMERLRNKKALKIQKIKDRIIPRAQEVMKPFLEAEFEDFETLMLEPDGRIRGAIFSHLEDFKTRFRKTKNL